MGPVMFPIRVVRGSYGKVAQPGSGSGVDLQRCPEAVSCNGRKLAHKGILGRTQPLRSEFQGSSFVAGLTLKLDFLHTVVPSKCQHLNMLSATADQEKVVVALLAR